MKKHKKKKKGLVLLHNRIDEEAKPRVDKCSPTGMNQFAHLSAGERSDFIERINQVSDKHQIEAIIQEAEELDALTKLKSELKTEIDSFQQLHIVERSIFKTRVSVALADHQARGVLKEARTEQEIRNARAEARTAIDGLEYLSLMDKNSFKYKIAQELNLDEIGKAIREARRMAARVEIEYQA